MLRAIVLAAVILPELRLCECYFELIDRADDVAETASRANDKRQKLNFTTKSPCCEPFRKVKIQGHYIRNLFNSAKNPGISPPSISPRSTNNGTLKLP